MTLNGVMAVTLRYFTEFGKSVPTHNRVDLWRNLCTSIFQCVYDVVVKKFTFAISSPDEFFSCEVATRQTDRQRRVKYNILSMAEVNVIIDVA